MPVKKIDWKTLVLSFSSAKRYWDCPGSYFKRYILREKPPQDQDLTETTPGLVVDRLCRYFFERVRAGRGAGRFMFDEESKVFQSLIDKYLRRPGVYLGEGAFAEDEDEAIAYISEISANMSDMIAQEELYKADIILSEDEANTTQFGTYQRPLVINDHLQVAGAFDLFVAFKGLPGRLIDYKASKSTHHIDPTQLKLYNIALIKKWNRSVAMAGFMLFKLKKPIWYRFSPQDLEETEAKFTRTAKNIVAEEFDFTPSHSACRLCPYRTSCSESALPDPVTTKKRSRPKVKAEKPESLNEIPEL